MIEEDDGPRPSFLVDLKTSLNALPLIVFVGLGSIVSAFGLMRSSAGT